MRGNVHAKVRNVHAKVGTVHAKVGTVHAKESLSMRLLEESDIF
jgi:hypothetical protein